MKGINSHFSRRSRCSLSFATIKLVGSVWNLSTICYLTKLFPLFQKIQNPNYSPHKFKLGLIQYANASAEILKKLSGMSGIPKFSKSLFDIFVCNLVEVRSNGGLFGTIEANKRKGADINFCCPHGSP